jgi:hypothetical protein
MQEAILEEHLSMVLHAGTTLTCSIFLLRMVLTLKHNQGQRASHWATMSGGLHVVKELVSTFNVDINARDNNARTALGLQRNDAVPDKIYPDIINFLQSNGGIV